MRKHVILAACLALAIIASVSGLTSTVNAAVPQKLGYQAVLTSAGVPVTGTVSVTFTLYDAEAGSPVWSETRSVTPDAQGRVSIQLGDSTILDGTVFSGSERWLGVQVDSDPEMTPRTPLASSSYSFKVGSVDGATGGRITGDVTVVGDPSAKNVFAAEARITLVSLNGDSVVIGPADQVVFRATDPSGNEQMTATIDPVVGAALSIRLDGTNYTEHTAVSSSYYANNAAKNSMALQKRMEVSESGVVLFGNDETDSSFVLSMTPDGPVLEMRPPETAASKALIHNFGGISLGPPGQVFSPAIQITSPDGQSSFDMSVTTTGISQSFYSGTGGKSAAQTKKMEVNETGTYLFGADDTDTVGQIASTTSGGVIILRQSANAKAAVTNYYRQTAVGWEVIDIATGNPTASYDPTNGLQVFDASSGNPVFNADQSGNLSSAAGAVFGSGNTVTLAAKDAMTHGGVGIVVGHANTLTGENASAIGDTNNVAGDNSLAIGINNVFQAGAVGAVAIGDSNWLSLNNTFALGFGNSVGSSRSAAFGRHNGVFGGGDNFVFGESQHISSTGDAIIGGGIYDTVLWAPNAVIGGGQHNVILGTSAANNGNFWSTIGGGRNNRIDMTTETQLDPGRSVIGGGEQNLILSNRATIAGGHLNSVQAVGGTVAGGTFNQALGVHSFLGGGGNNVAQGISSVVCGGGVGGNSAFRNLNRGDFSFIGGGTRNWMESSGNSYSSIVGGDKNTVNATHAFIGGGYGDTVTGNYSVIGGGNRNSVSGDKAVVSGGGQNSAEGLGAAVGGGDKDTASGSFSCVPGGTRNLAAGTASFAAGNRARALHDGAIVIAANRDLGVNDSIESGCNEQLVLRADNNFYLTDGSGSAPCVAGRFLNTSTGAYLSDAGVWTDNSDRNLKENLQEVDADAILDKIARLPISQWNFIVQGEGVQHIGPMAQDFYNAFGTGMDDKHIAGIDAQGIALAAIQALYKKTEQIDDMQAQIDRLERLLMQALAER